MEKEFTYQELQKNDGKNGNPAYISHKGIVYDITESELWRTGRHQNLHDAGDDHTTNLDLAPHGEEMLKRFPVVGKLI